MPGTTLELCSPKVAAVIGERYAQEPRWLAQAAAVGWPVGLDLKLSDSGVRRGTCMVGGKAAEAGAVTHGAVSRIVG